MIDICVALFFIECAAMPIASMLVRITPVGFRRVVGSPQFLPAVGNSIAAAFAASVLSVVLALLAAWCLERTRMRLKALFEVIFVLPMLIPSIAHGLGLIALFGRNGLMAGFLRLENGIYGLGGIIAGSVMYSFPVAFLMFSSILRYEDGMPYKAAEVLGVPPLHRFTGITMPYLKKPVISAFFAVFTMVITDYGVPFMVRGNRITLSVLMYDQAVSMMDYDAGSVIGAFLLLPAIAAFIFDILNPEKGRSGFVSEPVAAKGKQGAGILAIIFCIFISACVFAPIISFCIMVFETKYPVDPAFTLYHVQKTLNRGADRYLTHSIVYAFLVAVFGTLASFACAYLAARMRNRFSRAVHLVSILTMAVPGIVLGLSYVIFFHDSPLYGTILIVVLANTVHFFSSPYLMIYHALEKVNPDLEAVGRCFGIGRFYVIWDIILPKVRHSIGEMFTYFFVNSMMTISAVSFLAPPSPKPVALMINQFESQLLMESAAFVSLLILLVNVTLKASMSLFSKYQNGAFVKSA